MYVHDNAKEKSLQLALLYVGMGWSIFPVHSYIDGCCTCDAPECSDPAKHPLSVHGHLDGTTDAEKIRKWHDETQGLCNWGLATGEASGVFALDVDPRHGGQLTLAQLERQHGPLPLTLTATSGGGGEHRYFRWPNMAIKSRSAVAQGIDVRGEGGYVILPPSLHAEGNRYAWATPLETPIADAPPWLLALLTQPQEPSNSVSMGNSMMLSVASDLSNAQGVGEGNRNAELCRLIGIHLARGESTEQIEPLALAWAGLCNPPFTEAKTLDTLRRLAATHQRRVEQNKHRTPQADASARVNAGEQTPGRELTPAMAAGSELVPSLPWPMLRADAYHGLAGEIVRAIAPETEADPAGVILQLLVCLGNAIGHGPYFSVGMDRHYANLFALVVGDTVSGKGMALGLAKGITVAADPAWAKAIHYGLSSGEGLVERVQDADVDAEAVSDDKGNVTGFTVETATAGALEKRLLAVESEFAQVLRIMRREGNTLSPLLRTAWDGGTLEVMARRRNALRAENAHVSVIGHITPEEWQEEFKSVNAFNGFSNRFLYAVVKRSCLLPHGGNTRVLDRFREPLALAIAQAKTIGECRRAPEADRLWESVYPCLSESKGGAVGKAVERSRPQVMRLAMLYALLDGTPSVGVVHLRGALALWNYCEASARVIFSRGDNRNNTPPPLETLLLNAIIANPGVTRTGLREVVGHKVSAEAIEQALAWCHAQGLAYPLECKPDGGGRPAECWYSGREGTDSSGGVDAAGEQTPGRELTPAVANGVNSLPPHAEVNGTDTGVNSLPPALTLAELVAQVRSMGGRLLWVGGVVSVDADALTPEIAGAIQTHQAELQMLVPKAKPTPYPDAQSVHQAIRHKGQVVKDEEGNCTLRLYHPDPDLEAAWERWQEEICRDYLSDSDFLAALANIKEDV